MLLRRSQARNDSESGPVRLGNRRVLGRPTGIRAKYIRPWREGGLQCQVTGTLTVAVTVIGPIHESGFNKFLLQKSGCSRSILRYHDDDHDHDHAVDHVTLSR
jgi:hypothetical protein